MGKDSGLFLLLIIITFALWNGVFYARAADTPRNTYTISSFNYPQTTLKNYGWVYIRVDIPPNFCSVTMDLESDVDLDMSKVAKVSEGALPIICFRDGSLPVPDLLDKSSTSVVVETISNYSITEIQGLHNKELCYPLQNEIKVTLTNEQIYPGVWYLGLFNGIGDIRTQSKMINRGSEFSYSANVSVTGCTFANLSGQYCNQTVKINGDNSNQTCLAINDHNMYFTEMIELAENLIISADVSHNGTLTAYARYGLLPSLSRHDYAANLNKGPLIIQSPKVGGWYVSLMADNSTSVCYSSLVIQAVESSWKSYAFQTVLQNTPFESYYMPISENPYFSSETFDLEPLLSSDSSTGNQSEVAWTYFIINIPQGATGRNMHIRMSSKKAPSYEIYARFGGLPSDQVWDYFYRSKTNNSEGSKYFMVKNSTKEIVDFNMLYIREGTWFFAIKHPSFNNVTLGDETKMSISIERCPNDCSLPHGWCTDSMDETGLITYSYCACDTTHGGFDCSTEMVSHRGHIWQSFCLIASNTAATLPAYWALRNKAYAEWVIYTSSGISSALYHACDVGTWCVLSFHVLQFMDFWLSFMAIVSTFVYMTSIDDSSKRTIHAGASILTAMLAINDPTRSSNKFMVISIGAAGLFIGWLIELYTKHKSTLFSRICNYNIVHRREPFAVSVRKMLRPLQNCFRWGFILAGFIALGMAAASWMLETSENYWIWHSLWHVSIYTSSFLFMCSKVTLKMIQAQNSDSHNEQRYELARSDPIPRSEMA